MSPLMAIKSILTRKKPLGQTHRLGESSILGHPVEDASSCNEVDWRIKFSYDSFVQDQDPGQGKKE